MIPVKLFPGRTDAAVNTAVWDIGGLLVVIVLVEEVVNTPDDDDPPAPPALGGAGTGIRYCGIFPPR